MKRRCCCKRKDLEEQLEYLKKLREQLRDLIGALVSGERVQSYTIGNRTLTRETMNLKDLMALRREIQDEIDEIEARLCGRPIRNTVGVVPRDV